MHNVMAIAGVVLKEMIRRKDFYVLFVLTVVLVLSMGTINVFDDDRIVRYLKEFCLLLIWIASIVIAITSAARQIPAEREHRTIFPLLAKPVSRSELLLGKFAGCWLATGLALLLFYGFFAVLSASHEKTFPAWSYFEAVTAHWCMLGIVIAMTLLGSLVFAAPSSNSTICFVVVLGLLFAGRHLNKVAIELAEPASSLVYTLYFIVPQLGLFDLRDRIIHNHPPYEWIWWLLQMLYGLAYTSFFLLAGSLVFRRKSLN